VGSQVATVLLRRQRKPAGSSSGNSIYGPVEMGLKMDRGTKRQREHSLKAGIHRQIAGGSVMFMRIRTFAFGVAAAAAFFIIPVSAFSQSVEIGPGGVRIGRGGQCEELRRACENKDRLGEQGEGNCRRYRETCQRPARRDVCGELRAACLNKDQLGEQGEGNCRRYRQTCRGRI